MNNDEQIGILLERQSLLDMSYDEKILKIAIMFKKSNDVNLDKIDQKLNLNLGNAPFFERDIHKMIETFDYIKILFENGDEDSKNNSFLNLDEVKKWKAYGNILKMINGEDFEVMSNDDGFVYDLCQWLKLPLKAYNNFGVAAYLSLQ